MVVTRKLLDRQDRKQSYNINAIWEDVYDIIIVGAGGAGMTAGIYASRSGLRNIILEKATPGGQAATAPLVENYPGFGSITGIELMEKIKEQCLKHTEIAEGEDVLHIRSGFQIETDRERYSSRAVIIATGASFRKLNVKGEDELLGRGVSYCATCDGFFFRNKKVMVVGGGNRALSEALYLNLMGVETVIVHRRDQLRADKVLQESAFSEGIEVLYSSQVKEIRGKERVESVVITREGREEEIPCDGIFVSIGEEPNSRIARELGVDLDDEGYIKVDQWQRTNVKNVYGAGDVVVGVKQIITACAQGAVAALSAYADLKNPYWAR
jgi:thioredoxin reductase (NADPH)